MSSWSDIHEDVLRALTRSLERHAVSERPPGPTDGHKLFSSDVQTRKSLRVCACPCTTRTCSQTSTRAHIHMHTFVHTPIHAIHTYTRQCTHIHIRTPRLHTLTQCTYTFAYVFLHSSHMHTHPQTCTRMHANTSACTQMHTCWRRQVALPIRWFRIMDCRSIVFMKKNPRRFQKTKLGFAVCRAAAESVRMSGVWCVGRRGGGLPANAGRVQVPRRL